VREGVEETGWRPTGLEHLVSYQPTNGLSDQRFHLFIAAGADHVGEPTDTSESERVEWIPAPEVRRLVSEGAVPDGLSLTALLYAMAFGHLGP
jgi:8-oxo-dGTP pyrophosphatase MutT (NUDIX family)